mmetsp:Transcript_28667/g.72117  ORF Transcript_28667/g.72117 Transcript_28667/m.72117 type:complete len:171 (-) Transcript_28667:93-605(-)
MVQRLHIWGCALSVVIMSVVIKLALLGPSRSYAQLLYTHLQSGKVITRPFMALVGRLRVEPQRLGLVVHHADAALVSVGENALREGFALRCALYKQAELLRLGSRARHCASSPRADGYIEQVSRAEAEHAAPSRTPLSSSAGTPLSSSAGRCAGPGFEAGGERTGSLSSP